MITGLMVEVATNFGLENAGNSKHWCQTGYTNSQVCSQAQRNWLRARQQSNIQDSTLQILSSN